MTPVPARSLRTDRLTLRPAHAGDADRAFDIQGDWEVARMLSLASFPPDRKEIEQWFADHPRQWAAGQACRFAIVLEGEMVGLVDVDGLGEGEGTLGYWLERTVWGRGYITEAANAATRFALEDLGLSRLKAGHVMDNPASGRVLAKCGFTCFGRVRKFSRSRQEHIWQCRYEKHSGVIKTGIAEPAIRQY